MTPHMRYHKSSSFAVSGPFKVGALMNKSPASLLGPRIFGSSELGPEMPCAAAFLGVSKRQGAPRELQCQIFQIYLEMILVMTFK